MSTIRAAVFHLGLLLFVLCCVAMPALTQPYVPKVEGRTMMIKFVDEDFHGVLGAISVGNKVPMGVQRTSGKEPAECASFQNVDFKQVRLGVFLDFFMETCSIYKWKSDGRVINIVPVTPEPSILDTMVTEFKADRKTPRQMVNLLFETPAVKGKMKELKLTRDTSQEQLATVTAAETGEFSLNLQNKTVAEILNQIVGNTNSVKYWTHEGPYPGKNSIVIKIF